MEKTRPAGRHSFPLLFMPWLCDRSHECEHGKWKEERKGLGKETRDLGDEEQEEEYERDKEEEKREKYDIIIIIIMDGLFSCVWLLMTI